MKTLEQWQKELPDYDVWAGRERDVQPDDEYLFVLKDGTPRWSRLLWTNTGAGLLAGCRTGVDEAQAIGATFRRKKERQREFKIESDAIRAYVIDGDESITFAGFLEKENIKSATLIVDERGGE